MKATRQELLLEKKVEAARQRLVQLNDLAEKVLSQEDYKLYRQYVLGEEGQRVVAEEGRAGYIDDWWKRGLSQGGEGEGGDDREVDGQVGDNREVRTWLDEGTADVRRRLDDWPARQPAEPTAQESDRGTLQELFRKATHEETGKRVEDTDKDMDATKTQGWWQDERRLESDWSEPTRTQTSRQKSLRQQETEKIDEILSIIDEILAENSDQS